MEPLDEAPERRVKDRLRRYSDLLDEIDMQERRLDQMRADMGGVRSPSCDGMPKGAFLCPANRFFDCAKRHRPHVAGSVARTRHATRRRGGGSPLLSYAPGFRNGVPSN